MSKSINIDKTTFAKETAGEFDTIGHSVPRVDTRGHVTGGTQFYADHDFRDTLHLVCVRSSRHHALIKGFDASEAEKMPDVVRVITHKDVPNNWYTILRLIGIEPDDEPVLAEDRVLYKGEPIAAIVAKSEQAARRAAEKVRVTYEDLEPVFDVEEAVSDASIVINEKHGQNYFLYEGHECRRVRLGDVDEGFEAADHVIEQRYESSPIEHAPTETTGCIAVPETNGRFTIYSNTQALFFTLDNTGITLDIPFADLRLVGGTVGGGFGGKVDVMVEPLATLAAKLTGKPVKFAYSREEEMQVSSPRAAERIYIKDGIMNDGRIIARKVRMYGDAGAYSRHSPYGGTKAAAHMPGPYAIPNVWIDSYCVYTNRTPSSAMRGFGCTIGDFALESQMDIISKQLDMDPYELRLLNAYRDGDMKAHRKIAEGTALVEVIQKAAEMGGTKLADRFANMSSVSREGLDG